MLGWTAVTLILLSAVPGALSLVRAARSTGRRKRRSALQHAFEALRQACRVSQQPP